MAPLIPIAMALAELAPTAMRFFGAGEKSTAVAEKMVDIAQQVTGASSPEEALQRLQIDAKLQHDFNLAVMASEADLEKAYLADVQDARQREVQIATAQNAPYLNKIILPVLALIVIFGGFLILQFSDQPDVRQAAVILMTMVLSYFFGTSQGSTKANQMLRDIARKEAQ